MASTVVDGGDGGLGLYVSAAALLLVVASRVGGDDGKDRSGKDMATGALAAGEAPSPDRRRADPLEVTG